MTDSDPLAGLHDVCWDQLQHSYGTADDVPGHLLALQAGSGEDETCPPEALLANNIVHQGTRSQAAVYTVPFLVRMALDARLADRHRFVSLLVAIAIGLDNNHLPGGYDPEEDRAVLAEVRGEAEESAQWIAEASDDEERARRRGICEQSVIDAEAVVRCYEAVQEALPDLAVLLTSDTPELRAETANLLAWFPEYAGASVPLLEAFVARETSPGAAATGLVALGLLGARASVPFVASHLDSCVVELRWGAAFALTRLGIAGPAVVDALTQVVARPPERTPTMPFLSGSYTGLAVLALAGTPAAATPRTVEAVFAGLADCTAVERYADRSYLADALFTLAFPGEPTDPPRSFDELGDVQQRAVRLVAEDHIGWPYMATDALRRWGIPTRHSELLAYTGIAQGGG